MLSIKNLSAGYSDLHVLSDVSLELLPGAISVLMGPNGAGKSTLLKSVFNLTDIVSGRIFFQGKDITRLPAHILLSRGVGFVSQGRVNFSSLSVADNLFMGGHLLHDKIFMAERVAAVYRQFPLLKEKANAYAFTLSGGQQQMLAIGRALMNQPKLLLLDEPSLGLSPKLVKEVFQKIKEINTVFGTTILIVEHNIKSLMDIADEGYVMVGGRIIAHDACAALKNSPIMRQVFVGAFD